MKVNQREKCIFPSKSDDATGAQAFPTTVIAVDVSHAKTSAS